jgi:hypothetical protein
MKKYEIVLTYPYNTKRKIVLGNNIGKPIKGKKELKFYVNDYFQRGSNFIHKNGLHYGRNINRDKTQLFYIYSRLARKDIYPSD